MTIKNLCYIYNKFHLDLQLFNNAMLYQEEIYITIKRKKKDFFKTEKLREVTSVTFVNKLQNN